MNPKRAGLSGNAVKLIAMLLMVVDHVAFLFVPPTTALYIVMRTAGKIVAPAFCFLIAEGYFHTRDVRRYALRLALFAWASHLPFSWFAHGGRQISLMPTSMIFTLFCGLLALWAWDKIGNRLLGLLAVFALCALTFASDWRYFGVLFIWAFGALRDRRSLQMLALAGLCLLRVLYQLTGSTEVYAVAPLFGMLLAIPLLLLYNGERGRGGAAAKWGFYIFYPAHLVLLTGLYILLF